MNKKIILISVALVVLVGGGIFIFNQAKVPSKNLSAGPVANFIFRYGVGAKNGLNTFDQTYTKDMIMQPSIRVGFKLTTGELAGIYKKINDLKLFEPGVKTSERNVAVKPCFSYYLMVQIDTVQKDLSWDNCKGKINDRFQQFSDYIISVIESKEEYKKLPAAKGV